MVRVPAIVLFSLTLGACDSVTGSESGEMEVRLRTDAGSSASMVSYVADGAASDDAFVLANGPIDLGEVASILVGIRDVQVLPATAEEGEAEPGTESEAGGWISLVDIPTEDVELLDLSSYTTLGTLPENSQVAEIVAVRLVFGNSTITIGEETADLFIPSGKVTIPTPALATDGATVDLQFLAGASVDKVILTGRGYLMPPVIRLAGVEDEDL